MSRNLAQDEPSHCQIWRDTINSVRPRPNYVSSVRLAPNFGGTSDSRWEGSRCEDAVRLPPSSLKPQTKFGNPPPTTPLLRGKQEWLPAGVHRIPGARVDPSVAMRGGRTPGETETCFGGKPVPLVHVAAPTACDHVFPRVFAPPRSRYYMIEALSRAAAVLTSVTVPSEHRTPAHGDSPLIRDLDIGSKLYDGRHLDRE
jgi:hypothetical protein